MNVTDYVDPFIGTTGSGKAIVGPQRPHGMVKLCPDTWNLPNGGYDYNDCGILCFSHTHLEGVGGRGARGNVGVMPTAGPLETDEYKYCSHFRHESEKASVGYYSVLLEDCNIKAELAATLHCGLHRYTYPKTDNARVIVNMGHTLGMFNQCTSAHIERAGDFAVRGWGIYPLTPWSSPEYTVYFYIELSKTFSSCRLFGGDESDPIDMPAPALRLGLSPLSSPGKRGKVKVFNGLSVIDSNRAGASLEFPAIEGEQIYVKVGISFISMEQAAENLKKELPDCDFEKVVSDCRAEWENVLSRISARDESDEKKKIFYSALYRALNQPTQYTEHGKYMVSASGKSVVKDAGGRKFYSDIWAIWDTFRSTHPMQVLLEPERCGDVDESLVDCYRESGWLPTCPAPGRGISSAMIGHNTVSVILDAYVKGCRDFDVETAYEAMKKSATVAGPSGINMKYAKLGYIPGNTDREEDFSVSETMELIYADWCTAEMARYLGKTEDYKFFIERAMSYQKLFDKKIGLIRRKDEDGNFIEPFNPLSCFKDGYCESSVWEYSFFVPHDVQGLINLFGSRAAFINQLDNVFKLDRHNFENETSLHLPFLYCYAGAPWRTADIVRDYLLPRFTAEKDGLYGEDDDGALSAFNAFAWMGIYPSCPGQEAYTLFSPWLDGWTLKLGDGKTFTVKAVGNSEQNRYIGRAELNGKPYNKAYINHSDILAGGELVLHMVCEPTDFATSPDAAPPSVSKPLPEIPLERSGRIVYSDMRANRIIAPAGYESSFKVCAEVYNDACADAEETIPLYINGEETDSQIFILKSGEKKRVSFSVPMPKNGACAAAIGDAEPLDLETGDLPGKDWLTFTNTSAAFYTHGRHIYILANGDQGMEHYGMIFARDKVYGDYDIITKITYADYTSPYAAAGIVVRNSIGDPIHEGFQGGVYMGAMCTRGFYCYLGDGPECYDKKSHWAKGAPVLPCWLKVERRGKHFSCFYSTDGVNYTLKDSGTLSHAADAQYVGLYNKSCIHDLRTAKFDYLDIKRLNKKL